MKHEDRKKFAALMASMAEVFDGKDEVSALKMEIYYKTLESYPIEHISVAVSSLMKSRVYPSMPKPAEIIGEIEGKNKHSATLAWLKVVSGISRVGNYQSVQFDDPVIHSAIQAMGGWAQLGLVKNDDLHWKQKEFEKLYEIFTERGGKHPAYLPGIHEEVNVVNGFNVIPVPVKIGFEEQKRIGATQP